MANPRPDKLERLRQEDRAMELQGRGWSLRRIGVEMGLSKSQVHRILDRVAARELKRLGAKFEHLRIQQANEYDHIKEECSDGWERSKQPRRMVRQTTDAEGNEVTITTAEERDGNLAFMDRRMAAMAGKAKVLGLNVADKPNDEGPFTLASLSLAIHERSKAYDERLAKEAAQAEARRTRQVQEQAGLPGHLHDDAADG